MRQIVSILDVRKGDVIVEKSNRTTVRKIDKERCLHHVHINDRDCYSNQAEVVITPPENRDSVEDDNLFELLDLV